MTRINTSVPPSPIIYPDSDGKPMADNTKQARWIFVIYGNVSALMQDNPNVFVAADNLWYPKEGAPEIRVAPDVYVVFGRPKGDRGSYKQWEEDNLPLTVVFEVLSPNNTVQEMADKQAFYEEYGVEEYYVYDPDTNHLQVFLRRGDALVRVRQPHNHVSPRLGIRFDLSGPEMVIFHPDDRPFLTFEQLAKERAQMEEIADQAKREADEARRQADQARQRADQAETRLSRLRELSRKARRGQATPEELAELEQLEEDNSTP